MVLRVHRRDETARCRIGLAGHRRDHLVGVGALGLLDRSLPHHDADVSRFHRVVGQRLVLVPSDTLGLGIVAPLLDELGVGRALDAHEVVPGRQVADQWLGVDATQLFLTHRESHHRHVGRLQALVAELLVERHVGVAVDRRDHRGLLAFGSKLLDLGDDALVVGMAERGVVLQDVFVLDALAVQEGTQDLVSGARVDIVGAQQHEALGAAAVLAHQVFHRRDGLLVRRRTGVEHVLGELFTLVLHGVEQQAVQLFVDRQHALARHAGPATEGHCDLVLADQLTRFFGEQRPVRRRVDDHRLELLAQHAALGIDLVDRHQHGVFQHGF